MDTERPGPKLSKKLFVLSALLGLIVSLAGSTLAHDDNKAPQPGEKPGEKIERSLAVDAQATVTLCVASGTLTVRGWEKSEVHVRSLGAGQLDFRRVDRIKDTSKPATRVDVMLMQRPGMRNATLDCQAFANVEMEVPAGATVQVQTRDGDISISGVAAAYAGSQNGDITIERATKLVEAGSVGGSIILKDSSGRVNLSSAGGGVEAVNIRAVTPEDTFEVGTVSGDIQLNRVSTPKVSAKTVNGTVTMSGPLAKSGSYGFTNMAGDLVLEMPHDASFQLIAKVSEKQSIHSDFKLTFINEPPSPPKPVVGKEKPLVKHKPAAKGGPVITTIPVEKPTVITPYALRRVTAICGTGDATISVASFGGTVRLKKI